MNIDDIEDAHVRTQRIADLKAAELQAEIDAILQACAQTLRESSDDDKVPVSASSARVEVRRSVEALLAKKHWRVVWSPGHLVLEKSS